MTNLIAHPTAVMVSDLHIGDPRNGLDNFTADECFERLLNEIVPARCRGRPR